MKKFLAMVILFSEASASSQSSLNSLAGDQNVAPIQGQTNEVPGDKVIPHIDGSKIDEIVAKAQETWKEEQERLANEALAQAEGNEAKIPRILPKTLKRSQDQQSQYTRLVPAMVARRHSADATPEIVYYKKPTGTAITVFKSNLRQIDEDTVTLPSGAHAYGRVKFGEEVTANSKTEVLVELDYAFLGPNRSVVELTGCTVWISVDSNFETQKIRGAMKDMTCTMPTGRVFTVNVGGPLVEVASGYAGIESDLIIKGPAKAAALKFLGEITKAYGAATSAAQTTTDVVSGERYSEKSSNVSGDKKAYVEGKVIEAHGDFLKYISSFFESLQPTLALPAGTKVHLINRYNVKIPKVFFKKGALNG